VAHTNIPPKPQSGEKKERPKHRPISPIVEYEAEDTASLNQMSMGCGPDGDFDEEMGKSSPVKPIDLNKIRDDVGYRKQKEILRT